MRERASMALESYEQESVQSCITSVSLPNTLDAFLHMVEKNHYKGKYLTDMDVLLNFRQSDNTSWTAPKWMTQGDILFFYHTKKARAQAGVLYQQAAQTYSLRDPVMRLLKRITEIANQYAGTIFGCAEVAGSTEYLKSDLFHFDSRFFAPLAQFYAFKHPLSAEKFADYVKIGQNTTPPLYRQQFDGIKSLVSQQNSLPAFLANARFGEASFRTVDQESWPTISCGPNTRFIHEAVVMQE